MEIAFPREGTSRFSSAESQLVSELLEAIRDIRYGSVLVIIHDHRLVEIQKTKKVRLTGSRDDY